MKSLARSALCAVSAFSCLVPAMASQVSEFEAIVQSCKTAFDARPLTDVTRRESANPWVKRLWAPTVVSYDVIQTNSLVSPFTGYIEVVELATLRAGSDENEIRRSEVAFSDLSIPSVRTTTRINYRYSQGAWSVAIGSNEFLIRRAGQPSFDVGDSLPVQLSPAKLAALTGPVSSCILKTK